MNLTRNPGCLSSLRKVETGAQVGILLGASGGPRASSPLHTLRVGGPGTRLARCVSAPSRHLSKIELVAHARGTYPSVLISLHFLPPWAVQAWLLGARSREASTILSKAKFPLFLLQPNPTEARVQWH